MAIDNTYGATPGQASSQTGNATGRSPEYDDGLTVQDTTHSAAPRTGSDTSGISNLAGTSGMGERNREFGDNRDGSGRDRTDDVTTDESGTLISADKVVGTAVYDAGGERLGTIDSIMLNKRSGKVAYAVMSFGGFLGIGERFHPLPWNVLTYDNAKGGYNVQHSADDMRKAPNYSRDEVDSFDGGSTRSREVDDYYGVNVARGASAEAGATDATRYGAVGTGVRSADAVGDTVGAGSTGMASTGMGSNRNF